MLKRLKIHRFRNVEPGTELHFAEHFNVLLGKNGTGKTTLLELISMILREDFSALREEEFDIEYEFSFEDVQLYARFENKRRQKSPEALKSKQMTAERFSRTKKHDFEPRVFVTTKLDGESLDIDVLDSNMRWREQGGAWKNAGLVDVFCEAFINEELASLLLGDWVEVFILQINISDRQWTYRFDESLYAFESITSDASRGKSLPGRIPAIKLVQDFDPSTYETRARVFVPYGYNPKPPLHGQPSTEVEVAYRVPYYHAPAIVEFPKLANFSDIIISLAVERSIQESGKIWWHFGHAEFLFSRPGGSINHNALSYGQKRLLAFLYYLDANEKYVIADELVNGMHHDWITACIDLIGDRQSFLTSQNPLLLDYIPLESAKQAQQTFIQCEAKTTENRVTYTWANLSADDAHELFADYEVGIQRIGELLRVRGLW